MKMCFVVQVYFHANQTHFLMQKTRIEIEAEVNSEMADQATFSRYFAERNLVLIMWTR